MFDCVCTQAEKVATTWQDKLEDLKKIRREKRNQICRMKRKKKNKERILYSSPFLCTHTPSRVIAATVTDGKKKEEERGSPF